MQLTKAHGRQNSVHSKTCTKCHADKPISDFRLKNPGDGKARRPNSWCKPCENRHRTDRQKVAFHEKRAAEGRPVRPQGKRSSRSAMHNWLIASRKSRGRRDRSSLTDAWIAQWQHVTHCPVSGLPFKFGAATNNAVDPLTPSLDRLDPTLGYTPDNTRVVCAFVNFAKNAWSQEVFEFLILATASHLRH